MVISKLTKVITNYQTFTVRFYFLSIDVGIFGANKIVFMVNLKIWKMIIFRQILENFCCFFEKRAINVAASLLWTETANATFVVRSIPPKSVIKSPLHFKNKF